MRWHEHVGYATSISWRRDECCARWLVGPLQRAVSFVCKALYIRVIDCSYMAFASLE